jgi:molybdopterin-guanine dinucleotide biosynthesis protein A
MAIDRKLDGSSVVRGCVLAGGAASRFGGAKTTALLAGRPLVSYPLAALADAGLEPAIVAKPETELPDLDAEVWLEPPEPRHPLCGIVEALRRTAAEALVFAPCDLPFLDPNLVRWLAAAPEPLVVAASQPLLGRYSTVRLTGAIPDAELAELYAGAACFVLPSLYEGFGLPLAEAMAAGRSMAATVAALGARLVADGEVGWFGDPQLILANVNSPDDLDAAERRLAGR